MRAILLVPGSGGTFYCQNCLRDAALARSLRKRGDDVMTVPLYLPYFTNPEKAEGDAPVFFGAVHTYLAYRWPWAGRLWKTARGWLDSTRLLRLAATRAGSTDASGLDGLTLSMLDAETGPVAEELGRLIAWLNADAKPDVIHISNALLIGLAPRLRRETGAAIVCSLQDEDDWVDAMSPDAARTVWSAAASHVPQVDLFMAPTRFYADFMAGRLNIPSERLRVVRQGVPLVDPPPGPAGDPLEIGFLSRLNAALGLDRLVEAYIGLARSGRFPDLRLRALGGAVGHDRDLLASLQRRLTDEGLSDRAVLMPDFDVDNRADHIRRMTVMSVPAPGGEAFGLFMLEAWAQGLPVVLPRAGGYTEMVEESGGGLLYDPAADGALEDTLSRLLGDDAERKRLGRIGWESVRDRYSIGRWSDRVQAVFAEAMRRRETL